MIVRLLILPYMLITFLVIRFSMNDELKNIMKNLGSEFLNINTLSNLTKLDKKYEKYCATYHAKKQAYEISKPYHFINEMPEDLKIIISLIIYYLIYITL